MNFYMKEYVSGTLTYAMNVTEDDLDYLNEMLKKATPAVEPLTMDDLYAIWNNTDSNNFKTVITVKNPWGGMDKSTVEDYVRDVMREWIYDDDPFEDLDYDDGLSEYWTEGN